MKLCVFCTKPLQLINYLNDNNDDGSKLLMCSDCIPTHKTHYRQLWIDNKLASEGIRLEYFYIHRNYISTISLVYRDIIGILEQVIDPLSFHEPFLKLNYILQLPFPNIPQTLNKLHTLTNFL